MYLTLLMPDFRMCRILRCLRKVACSKDLMIPLRNSRLSKAEIPPKTISSKKSYLITNFQMICSNQIIPVDLPRMYPNQVLKRPDLRNYWQKINFHIKSVQDKGAWTTMVKLIKQSQTHMSSMTNLKLTKVVHIIDPTKLWILQDSNYWFNRRPLLLI